MKAVLKFLFMFVIVAGIGGTALGWLYFSAEMGKAGPLEKEKIIYIAPGSVNQITATLVKENVVENEWVFRFATWKQRFMGTLKTGEFQFKQNISVAEAVALLQAGKEYQRQVTIPEGLTSYEIVELINKAEAMEGTIATIPAEGTLLPETYNYTHGTKRAAIIDRMADAMKKTLAEYWPKKEAGSLVKTPEEAVTLASIVERETAVTTERARVAGVFMNRIRTGMPLQSDPTVIYAITEGKGKLNRQLLRDDLNKQSPYNTYQVGGLPPGPIANPGRQSIIAVLAPEKNNFFYFVADGTGGHAFAADLDQHNRNVGQWRALQAQEKKP